MIVWNNLTPYNISILAQVGLNGFLSITTRKALVLIKLVPEDTILQLMFKATNLLEQRKKQEAYPWEEGFYLVWVQGRTVKFLKEMKKS